MIRAYARVSTADQTLGAQIDALTAAGAEAIYKETASGAKSDRKELARLLSDMQAGDVLLVTRLDRLARSTIDLLTIFKRVGDAGATFKSIAEAWADLTTPYGRLILTFLGGMAEFERELIKARTGEGRKRAQAAGVRFGRPSKLTKFQRQEALARLADGATCPEVARSYGVDPKTIWRLQNKAA